MASDCGAGPWSDRACRCLALRRTGNGAGPSVAHLDESQIVEPGGDEFAVKAASGPHDGVGFSATRVGSVLATVLDQCE